MALQNWIQNKTYTSIDEVSYNKNERRVFFELTVYSDSSKKTVLQKLNMNLTGDATYEKISGIISNKPENIQTVSNEFPDEITQNWLYMGTEKPCIFFLSRIPQPVFSSDAVGDASELPDPIGYLWEWVEREIIQEEFFKTPENDIYTLDTNTHQMKVCDTLMTADVWDSLFGIDVISAENTNLTKQIYLYLKQLSLYQGVEDA